jgi:hypothetical protein
MELPKIIPEFSEAKVAPKGKLNIEDVNRMIRNALIFFTPTLVLYSAQLLGSLNDHTVLNFSDMVPSPYVVGAFQGYIISTFLDYLKKLNDGKS